jgi:hypothetical protein
MVEAIQESTEWRDVTSSLVKRMREGVEEKSSEALERAVGSMSAMLMLAPREWMFWAVARPMPLAPPVRAMTCWID